MLARLVHCAPSVPLFPYPLMTVATAGTSPSLQPPSFELKSATLPLLALHLKTTELPQLAQDLGARFGAGGDSPDFFDHDGVVLDFSALPADAACDLPAVLALLRPYSLVPLAVRGAPPALAEAALAAGLVLAPAEVRAPAKAPPAHGEAPASTHPATETSPAATPAAAAPLAAAASSGRPTLVVDKPLRSGQKVYARDADLVVLAMVNPGAEVAADGHIHVYAPLRGKALAGARGNTQARIFSLCLDPELLSIAGTYRTSEHPLPAGIQGQPAQVRLDSADDGKLVFEPLKA